MLPSRYFCGPDPAGDRRAVQEASAGRSCRPAASSSTGRICRPAPTSSPRTSSRTRSPSAWTGWCCPATPLGVTPMHMPFEGTITLTPDTYMRVVTETCVSTAKHGAKYLLILNWHEGNIPSLAIAAEDLHREHGMTVLTVQACYVAAELYGHEMQRPDPRRRDRGAGGARPPAGARPSRPHRLFVRPRARPARWTSCAARAAISRC